MTFTNFKWFLNILQHQVKDFKKLKSVKEENMKLIFHFGLFAYFVECVAGHGLRSAGAGRGMWVSSRSIMQQNVRKTIFVSMYSDNVSKTKA